MTTTIETISAVLSTASYGVYYDDNATLDNHRLLYNGTVYKAGDSLIGNDGNTYELVMAYHDTTGSGYEGALFKSTSTGEYFRSHTGTEDGVDWDTNISIAKDFLTGEGFMTDQLKAMNVFNERIKEHFGEQNVPEITEVGHSLGGALAQVAGMIYGNEAISRNAPGIAHLTDNVEDFIENEGIASSFVPETFDYDGNFTLINMAGEMVSNLGTEPLTTENIIYPATSSGKILLALTEMIGTHPAVTAMGLAASVELHKMTYSEESTLATSTPVKPIYSQGFEFNPQDGLTYEFEFSSNNDAVIIKGKNVDGDIVDLTISSVTNPTLTDAQAISLDLDSNGIIRYFNFVTGDISEYVRTGSNALSDKLLEFGASVKDGFYDIAGADGDKLIDVANATIEFTDGTVIAFTTFVETVSIEVDDLWQATKKNVSEYATDLIDGFTDGINAMCPIVLDLDGDGVTTTALDGSSTYFDLDSNDFATKTGWVSSTDGLLSIDIDGNGKIDNSTELFSVDGDNATIDIDTYDTNGDGKLNSSDANWADVKLWIDADQDGYTDAGELHSLADQGVTELNLNFVSTDIINNGNWIGYEGTFTKDGALQSMADVWFKTDVVNSQYVGDYTMDWDTLNLPTLRGYGKLADLHIAMSMDSTLKTMVESLVADAELNGSYDRTAFQDMMFQWAGVKDIAVDSRGTGINDARMLEFLEEFMAEDFYQFAVEGANPSDAGGRHLTWTFESALDAMVLRFEAQTIDSNNTSYNLFTDNVTTFDGDVISDSERWREGGYQSFDGRGEDSVMSGGEGNDDLHGGTGNDAYYFRAGDGFDEIIEGSGYDKIVFNDSVSANDISYERVNSHLYIHNDVTGDKILVQNWYTHLDEDHKIEEIRFVDGTIHTPEYVKNILVNQVGDDLNNDLYGADDFNDHLTGGKGNDDLRGYAGDDTYYFSAGDGNDRIYGESSGYDKIVFDSSVNVSDIEYTRDFNHLFVTNKTTGDVITLDSWFTRDRILEEVVFSDGTIHTSEHLIDQTKFVNGTSDNDYLNGYENVDDTLTGNAGNDTLNGKDGNDTYVFNVGDGADTINETSGVDSIAFGAGIARTDVTMSQVSNDLVLTIGTNGDKITINDWFDDVSNQVENFVFDSGLTVTNLSVPSILANSGVIASDLDPVVTSNSVNGSVLTGAVDLNITAPMDPENATMTITVTAVPLSADGTLTLADGTTVVNVNDTLTSAELEGLMFTPITSNGSYTFSYSVSDGVNTVSADTSIYVNDLNVITGTSGNETLYGTNGNDAIYGLEGNDTLRGLDGDDVYFFSAGHGNDTIYYENSGNDQIVFDNTVNVSDIQYSRSGSDLLISNTATGDSIAVDNWFHSSYPDVVEKIIFDDGTVHTPEHIQAQVQIQNGTSGNETLYGFDEFDDHLTGGAGNDTLRGEDGNDTYYFSAGHGNDTIYYEDNGDDKIVFDNTVNVSDIHYSRTGVDLLISNTSTGDSITVDNWFHSSYPDIVEEVVFSDGTIHTPEHIQVQVQIQVGTSGNETLYGFDNFDDHLTGGEGNDTLRGEEGNDTYYFSAGHGNDIIYYEDAGSDKIIFDNTIAVADIAYSRANNDLKIENSATGDSIIVDNWFNSSYPDIVEEIVFADGTIHTPDYINPLTQVITGTESNETLYGNDNSDDTLIGLGGNDTLDSGSGNDVLVGGEGNDTLRADSGDDFLQGDAGDDKLYGYNDSDTLSGGLGIDQLFGGNGDDFLIYDANDSVIDGDSGSDTLLVASNGSATSIDLGDSALKQLEVLDMRDGDADDSVSIDISELLSVSDTDVFTVIGDVGDDVTSNDTWTRGANVTEADGKTYATFSSGSADLNLMLGLNFNGTELTEAVI